jgi:RND family efflux transporter MFP subunit
MVPKSPPSPMNEDDTPAPRLQAEADGDTSDASSGPPAARTGETLKPAQTEGDTGRSTTRRVVIFAVLLAASLGILYKAGQRPRIETRLSLGSMAAQVDKVPPTVNVVRPILAATRAELKLPGETQAFFQTTLFAQVNGYLKTWRVDIGDRVKEGQLLALIETPELDEQLNEAKAKVEALKADVLLAETQLEFARITADRWNAAAPEGAVSQYERDEKNAEHHIAQARLQAAKAQLQLGQASVRRLESELSFKRVLAPFSGVITQRHIDVGSLITAGSSATTTSLFAIAHSDTIRVFVKVPQTAVPDITLGMPGRITSREFPGRAFLGKVDRTASAIDPVSRTLKVELLVPNPDLALLTGMYVTVCFEMIRNQPPFLIEAGALNLRPEGPQVAVVDPHDRIRFRTIRIARDLGASIEVAEGLHGDEWLAINLSSAITEGERVRPARLAPPAAGLSGPPSLTSSAASQHPSVPSTRAVGSGRSP